MAPSALEDRNVNETSQTQLQRLVVRHLEAGNAHRLLPALATLSSDCVFDDYALGRRFIGRAGAAAYNRLWWQAFGMTVDHGPEQAGVQCMPGGNVFVEARYTGIHRGKFFGIRATGLAVVFPFVCVITFRDGLIASKRFYYDIGGLLLQIGGRSIPSSALPASQRLPVGLAMNKRAT